MKAERGEEARHPIRVVSRRTGLTPAVLRAWEKRYGVVAPVRSAGGHRLYSDDDVQRLGLLRRAVEGGRAISQVAGLPERDLEELVEGDRVERVRPPGARPLAAVSAGGLLEEARRCVAEMDPARLERTLTRGALAISVPSLIDDVLTPLLEGIGTSWREGEVGTAHEHLASVVIRRFLEWLLDTLDVGEGAPVLLAATPAGERHEFGALLSAVSAASEGWKAIYLGPELPAMEIASAAARLGAETVTLSLVDPAISGSFLGEIRALREALPVSVRLIVGGPAEIISPLRPGVRDTSLVVVMRELREVLRREGGGG